ncbi:hypothetical protein PALI_a3014 [Pseudoalteromonas aliena SW19]|uniref:Uncharacterized protein n=1 Tax=Pseudoalteromonas aliena SW19 TaxID=1314866 RepID=A0ABR9E6B6_9GAMM|nr:hypothetical protein [Pseudoalteromonas aliena SW19]
MINPIVAIELSVLYCAVWVQFEYDLPGDLMPSCKTALSK